MSINMTVRPIGTMKSVFHYKNGTPRQSSLCESARGILTIEKSVFNNPEHSLEGLEEFSHAWIIFIFHKNNNAHTKAKVKPPRLDGQRVGVFSSRSPYRPNNIGLSLVKIDKVEGASIHVSGIDILDGSPILDIKPYIPDYDKPREDKMGSESSLTDDHKEDSEISLHKTDKGSTLSTCISHVGQTENESDVPLTKSERVSQSDDGHVAGVLATDDEKMGKKSNRNNAELDTRIQEQEKSSHQHAGTPDDHTDSNQNNSGSLHPVAKGFYALSAALERAGQKLGGSMSSCGSSSYDKHEDVLDSSNSSRDFDFSSILAHGEVINEDDDVDLLVGGIISKAALEVSGGSSSLDFRSKTSCTSELSADDDKPVATQFSLNASSIQNRQEKSNKKSSRTNTTKQKGDDKAPATVAPWLLKPPVSKLIVTFTSQAREQLSKFSKGSPDPNYRLQMLSSAEEAEKSISDILQEEPRSVYRRQHCQDNLYYFAVDILHVTSWFDENVAQVVRVKPVTVVPKLQQKDIEEKSQ